MVSIFRGKELHEIKTDDNTKIKKKYRRLECCRLTEGRFGLLLDFSVEEIVLEFGQLLVELL